MKIRAAGLSDLPAIMEIINEARRNLKEQGINQWQRSYPNAGVIERDIVAGNCYVAEEEGQVAASFAVSFDGDADYDKISNGSWRREGRFAVVHRVAVGAAWRGRGLASAALRHAEKLSLARNIDYLKIDTHRDNLPMRRVLGKNNFTLCGLIDIADGSSRIVFDKICRG